MTGLAAPPRSTSVRTPSRAILLVAVAITVILVVTAALTRGVLSHGNGLPAYRPQPVPGGKVFTSHLTPGVSYSLPGGQVVSADQPGLTVMHFDVPPAGLIVMRVISYPNNPKPDLAAAVTGDPNLQIVLRQRAMVGGEHATRFVVRAKPGTTEMNWFCPEGDRPCLTLPPSGESTVYVFAHGGTNYAIVGGSVSDSAAAGIRPIVDGVAATWQW